MTSAPRPASFFTRQGDLFAPTALTIGPWSPDQQHGGPPSALLGRALAGLIDREHGGFRLVRMTIELPRPALLTPLRATASVRRASRNVVTLEASLSQEGKVVATCEAIALRTAPGMPLVSHPRPGLPPPEGLAPTRFPFAWAAVSYADGIEVRVARGEALSGKAAAWLRPTAPLVEGEATTPLERLLLLIDAANGVSAPVSPSLYRHINPDISIALLRAPRGEWFMIDSQTSLDEGGTGLVDARLDDLDGHLGRSLQTLLVRPV